MLNGTVTKSRISGLKWTPLLHGGNYLLSLSHLQRPTQYSPDKGAVHICEQVFAVYDVLMTTATSKLDRLNVTDKGKTYTFI